MEESYINTNEGNNNILKFEINYFYKLDSENNICFDCGGAFPCFVSINNGVFICKFCAENHKKNLNYNISYIYDINTELDKYLLSFITRGGNSRFKRLCLQYEVPCMSISQNNQEKINKYIIRLGEYHRLLLKSEINCSEPPPPLYREVAHNLIDVNTIYFPEFENYTLFRGNNTSSNKNSNNNDESMTSKIWEGTKTTFNVMKTTSGIIYNTSKPIVSFLGNAAVTGLKFIGNSVWNYYTKNGEKDDKNNNNEINNDITAGNNIPMNYNNDMNYNNNNFNNNGNNQFDNYNNNRNMNNNFSYINNIGNNNNNYNYYQKNKNYLTNSNKFTIFTINEEKSNINNNMQNMQNNYYSKPIPNNINNKNNGNQIPYFYDTNCINNESINNITTYINNNNSINNLSKSKLQLLNHKNIIVNDKHINDNNFLYNNNNFNNNIPDSSKSKLNINNQDLPDNNYPNFSVFEKSMKNDNIILDKNVPNIIGEERYQEKARYPLYQSTNLLNDNTFTPSEFDDNN